MAGPRSSAWAKPAQPIATPEKPAPVPPAQAAGEGDDTHTIAFAPAKSVSPPAAEPVAAPAPAAPAPAASAVLHSDALDRDFASGTMSPGSFDAGSVAAAFEKIESAPAPVPPEPDPAPTVPMPIVTAVPEPPMAPPEAEPGPVAPVKSVTLADVYLKQGLRAEAADMLRAVLAEDPGNATARERLAALEPPAAAAVEASAVAPIQGAASSEQLIGQLQNWLRAIERVQAERT